MFKLVSWIAWRYLKGQRKRKGLLSAMTLFGILGVFFATMVPLVVVSIVSGFQEDIKKRILNVKGHVFVYSTSPRWISLDEKTLGQLKATRGVLSVEPEIDMEGLLDFGYEYQPVLIKGVRDNFFEDPINKKQFEFLEGDRKLDKPYHIKVGAEFKRNYFLEFNRRFSVVVLKKSMARAPEPKRFDVLATGAFKTGYLEYDSHVVYTSLRTLQRELGDEYEGRINKIVLKVDDPWQAERVGREIRPLLGEGVGILTWKEENANLFRALAIERAMTWLIIVIIIMVSIFNIMSALSMLVIDKRREIGILKTLGFTPHMITGIFLLEGVILSVFSSVAGLIVGSLVTFYVEGVLRGIEWIINLVYYPVQKVISLFNGVVPQPFEILPRDVYYIDQIPTDLTFSKIATIFGVVLIFAILSSLIPSLRASKEKVNEILREE